VIKKNSRCSIAVIGMACRYPGAKNLRELWENILSRRRQFRQMPDCRLPLAEYYSPDPAAPDKTYGKKAAVIDDFIFDWAGRRIPKSTFESTDIAHWLALEVALEALKDAGFDIKNAPTDNTGVIVGNTLTGEYSRAQGLRMRWPFVRKTLAAAARVKGLSPRATIELEQAMEAYYKSVFSPVAEDTLAGGLSNTIAGRICNFLNFHGGGYTVDGACSSSLIGIATAANALAAGDLDLALAGGVDISLDTFELIGFAKTGALTQEDMRVYDRRGKGFIPGEGSGFVVLKRLEDALASKNYIYAVLRGWGISSDGKGGLTAPSAKGQAAAITRAYEKAGYEIGTVDFIEGHGTGTKVGDKTELEGIALAIGDCRKREQPQLRPYGVTSFKSLVGHTKAAAGVGGFIKAVMAVNRRVLPPTANCSEPNAVFSSSASMLYPMLFGEIRKPTDKLRAGVTAAGFGGINCHATIESGDEPAIRLASDMEERKLLVSSQDAELLVLGADSIAALTQRVKTVKQMAQGLAEAELSDLSAHLAEELKADAPARAALVVENCEDALASLEKLERIVLANPPAEGGTFMDPLRKIFIGNKAQKTRVGFLFPGQGSQMLNMARNLAERHDWARCLTQDARDWLGEAVRPPLAGFMFKPLDRARDNNQREIWDKQLTGTEVAQPAICLASMLWAEKLSRLGIRPVAAGGHSLGELSAFHASGAFDGKTLLQLAALRGSLMSAAGVENCGAMASLGCSLEKAEALLSQVRRGYVAAANINSPEQIVISGERTAVDQAIGMAREAEITARLLPVSTAFHSRFVADAAEQLRKKAPIPRTLKTVNTKLFSGIEGKEIKAGTPLHDHFADQILSQVDFLSLVKNFSLECDIIAEVGPGKVLSGLANAINGPNGPVCFPVESKAGVFKDLNTFLAAYFIQGGSVRWEALFEDRLIRPFIPASKRLFIENPCERPLEGSLVESESEFSSQVGTLESIAAGFPDIPRAQMDEYLARRGDFIKAVIRADLQSQNYSPADGQQVAAKPDIRAVKTFSEKDKAFQDKSDSVSPSASIPALLLELVEKRSGFPQDSLSMELRLLDDLNLDSIKAAELVAEAAKKLGIAGNLDPVKFADASLEEIAAALEGLTKNSGRAAAAGIASDSALPETSIPELLLELVEKRTGFPQDSLSMELRLLDDLNLDSIKAAELVAEAAKRLGIAGNLDPVKFADASLEEIAAALKELARNSGGASPANIAAEQAFSKKTKTWVRDFVVEPMEEPLADKVVAAAQWRQFRFLLFAEEAERAVALALHDKLAAKGAQAHIAPYKEEPENIADFTHFIAILPKKQNEKLSHRQGLLNSIKRMRSVGALPLTPTPAPDGSRKSIGYIQFGGGKFGLDHESAAATSYSAMALAASLHLERPDLKIRVIDFAPGADRALLADKVLDEFSTASNYGAAGYDDAFVRRTPTPVLRDRTQYRPRSLQWSSDDVFLVAGGAKGITAECALALASSKKVRMAMVGSSPHPPENPATDGEKEIAATLERFTSLGLKAAYFSCDIADAKAVESLIKNIRSQLGEITGVIHGAGLNRPRALDKTSTKEAFQEISPKVLGALNICRALKEHPPKIIIGFSSIIGLSGMPRNGWYGFSNEILNLVLSRFRAEHPETHTLCIAFSVWDEVGMGVRLGSKEYLAAKGIDAIPTEEGIKHFLHLMENDPGADQVVATARLDNLDTWRPKPLQLPQACRFLEKIRYYYPKVEAIARAHLSLEKDGYLHDHNWRGTYLFPTVFGLEAMAQAAAYVAGLDKLETYRIDDLLLERPIAVDPENGVDIEIRAEVLEKTAANQKEQCIAVEIATEQTGFAKAHFSAIFKILEEKTIPEEPVELPATPLDIDPEQDLYGWLLFQGPRFRRIEKIYSLDSKKTVIQAKRAIGQTNDPEARGRILGDPFFRDALLQSIQLPLSQDACLPVKINSLEHYHADGGNSDGLLTVRAVVTQRTEEQIVAEVMAVNDKGQVVERLGGYRAQILEHNDDYPTAEELADSGRRNNGIPEKTLNKPAPRQEHGAPEILDESALAGKLEFDLDVYRPSIRKGPQGRPLFIFHFPVTFRETANLSRNLFFSHYFSWIGKLREFVLHPVYGELVRLFSSGKWGMVTNFADTRIFGEAVSGDIIEGCAWIDRVYGKEGSTVDLCFDWKKILPGGERKLIAQSIMGSTWVAIKGHGVVEVRPFPDFASAYLDKLMPPAVRQSGLSSFSDLSEPADLGQELYREPTGPVKPSSLLNEQTFETSLEDANLVGNIYFSNYYAWQGRVRDQYFQRISPQHFQNREKWGEFRCSVSRIEHMNEAMPFDQIAAKMHRRVVYERGIRLLIDYYRLVPDGS